MATCLTPKTELSNLLVPKITNLNISMVEHIKITLRQKSDERGIFDLFKRKKSFDHMEPINLVEDDNVANEATMKAVDGFEVLFINNFHDAKNMYLTHLGNDEMKRMRDQEFMESWKVPEYIERKKLDFGHNKTIELLIKYSAPGLSPVKIIKGFNQI